MQDKLVLVIDDEADSRILLSQALQSFGCRVVTAHGGDEGLRKARDSRPDLVTLDLMMPQVTGAEVLRQLRDEPHSAGIPVLIVSIVAKDHKAQMMRDHPANPANGRLEFLDKPPTPENLAEALSRILGEEKAGKKPFSYSSSWSPHSRTIISSQTGRRMR